MAGCDASSPGGGAGAFDAARLQDFGENVFRDEGATVSDTPKISYAISPIRFFAGTFRERCPVDRVTTLRFMSDRRILCGLHLEILTACESKTNHMAHMGFILEQPMVQVEKFRTHQRLKVTPKNNGPNLASLRMPQKTV